MTPQHHIENHIVF